MLSAHIIIVFVASTLAVVLFIAGWVRYNLVAVSVLLALGIPALSRWTDLSKASQTRLRNWGNSMVRGFGLLTPMTREIGIVRLSMSFPIKAYMG